VQPGIGAHDLSYTKQGSYSLRTILGQNRRKPIFRSTTRPACSIKLMYKVIVAQLVKKFFPFLWNPMAYYLFHKNRPLDHILSQINSIHIHFFDINLVSLTYGKVSLLAVP
jgi:hypothetical protein